jgi:bifunctional enzyme CysN/CysC
MASPALLKLVVVGHVDHGKSTLIGRLLFETGSLLDGRVEELKKASSQRGVAFEWSFALDAMQAERDQAVTIETTRIRLHLPGREVLLIDAPGHREFLAKMITGAAVADAALLIVDAVDGIQDQTRRHAYLLALLGITQIIIAVNKMDRVDFAAARFETLARELNASLKGAGLAPLAILPVVAPDGDNLTKPSKRMAWYKGPPLAAIIAGLAVATSPEDQPLRLPIEDVYRVDERRLYVGRVESGQIKPGDEILFSPSNKIARIASVELWPGKLLQAEAGRSVGIALDRPLFVERGELVSHVAGAPILNQRFRATVVWLGNEPLKPGQSYRMQLGTATASVQVEAIERVMDSGLSAARAGNTLARDEIGEVIIRSPRLLALDDAAILPRTGRFVLREPGGTMVAAGLTRLKDTADFRPVATGTQLTPVDHQVSGDLRARRSGHRGGVLWLTGLSGAGKSTLAMAVEEHLFRKGYSVYVLDGDNIRSGLNSDLGFAPQDRVENIRRVGELAALFADAGMICITAFISPFTTDRARARVAAGAAFHEIYISADLATCEQRDTKGLYRKARTGEIKEFTGISAAYEPPETPELTVDTGNQPVEACIELIVGYIERNFVLNN